MNLLRFYAKISVFLFITVLLAPLYFCILLVLYRWRHTIGPIIVQFYSKVCLLIFRVYIEQVTHFRIKEKGKKGILIIANHTSFLDIFVLSALFGSVFVSKAEVKYYPIIGQIAWLMGVIFLDRKSSHEKLKVINTIVNTCSNQILVVFPQGTTSRIAKQLPFQRGVFKTVELNPEISLLPVTLYYKEDAKIAWVPSQSLKENVKRVCSQRTLHVKVIVHDLVGIDVYQGKTASQICKIVEHKVLEPLQRKYGESKE
jgi:1-acyl-sn-glycerol-3-phosphate acyltransferase